MKYFLELLCLDSILSYLYYMQSTNEQQEEFSLKNYFVPFTTIKAIHLIVIIGIIVYANMLFNGFVWDDFAYIINNPFEHVVNIANLFGNNSFNSVGQYRPLSALYFAFIYSLFGNIAFFYHFFQLLFHITCSVLIFILYQRYLKKSVSFFLALIFLIHPINVESVSYISQTDSPLFTLLGLIPLLIYIKEKKLSDKKLFFIFALLLLSLLIKETGALFIVLLLIYALIYRREDLKKLFLGTGIILAIYAFLRFFIGNVYLTVRSETPIASLNLLDRLSNIPLIIFYYLKTFIFPYNLVIDQQWTVHTINFSMFYLPLSIEILIIFIFYLAGKFIYKFNKALFKNYVFFISWFLLGIVFHSNLFPLDLTVADRWFYFTLIGLLGTIGVFYQSVQSKIKTSKVVVVTILSIILLLFIARTVIRNENWNNNLSLYTHDAKILDNFDLENNLGGEYLANDNLSEAFKHFNLSIKFMPNGSNLTNLGIVYEDLGDFTNAKKYFDLALHSNQYNNYYPHKHGILLYTNYSYLIVLTEKPQNAENIIKLGLSDYPDSDELWFIYGLENYKEGKIDQAFVASKNAYILNPSEKNYYLYSHIINNQPITINEIDHIFHFKFYKFSETE